MQRLEVSGAVRPLYGSLGVKGLSFVNLTANPPLVRHSNDNVQKYMLVGIAGFKTYSLPTLRNPYLKYMVD